MNLRPQNDRVVPPSGASAWLHGAPGKWRCWYAG